MTSRIGYLEGLRNFFGSFLFMTSRIGYLEDSASKSKNGHEVISRIGYLKGIHEELGCRCSMTSRIGYLICSCFEGCAI